MSVPADLARALVPGPADLDGAVGGEEDRVSDLLSRISARAFLYAAPDFFDQPGAVEVRCG